MKTQTQRTRTPKQDLVFQVGHWFLQMKSDRGYI
jgi:hypothetical protein